MHSNMFLLMLCGLDFEPDDDRRVLWLCNYWQGRSAVLTMKLPPRKDSVDRPFATTKYISTCRAKDRTALQCVREAGENSSHSKTTLHVEETSTKPRHLFAMQRLCSNQYLLHRKCPRQPCMGLLNHQGPSHQ